LKSGRPDEHGLNIGLRRAGRDGHRRPRFVRNLVGDPTGANPGSENCGGEDARAALFGRFLDEAAKLYSDALQTSRDDVTGLIQIYALTNRIRLMSSPEVVEAADTVVRVIVDT
jgi:hypothetical protein